MSLLASIIQQQAASPPPTPGWYNLDNGQGTGLSFPWTAISGYTAHADASHVIVAISGQGMGTITGVTLGGVAMTLLEEQVQAGLNVALFERLGSNDGDIVISTSGPGGTPRGRVDALSLVGGVAQTAEVSYDVAGAAQASPRNDDITTLTADAEILTLLCIQTGVGSGITPVKTQAEQVLRASGTLPDTVNGYLVTTQSAGAVGDYTNGATWTSGADDFVHTLAAWEMT